MGPICMNRAKSNSPNVDLNRINLAPILANLKLPPFHSDAYNRSGVHSCRCFPIFEELYRERESLFVH